MEPLRLPEGCPIRPDRAGAGELAAGARRVIEEIVSGGWRFQATRQHLSDSLGFDLTGRDFAAVVAEVAALAWVEVSGQAVRLPRPLRPIEALLERPGTAGLEAALETLWGVAVEVRANGDPGEAFYEDFLAQLDPQARARHSVYLTPAPLVRMVVRSVDTLLEERLGLAAGLASPEVGLLDPAVGTGAFLLEALGRARVRERPPCQTAALWQGFEVQPGAYVAGRLRLGRWLGDLPTASDAPRVKLHLRDLLAADSPLAGPPESRWGTPQPSALVVLGNPPWSGTGFSSSWVEQLLRAGYPRPDGRSDQGYYRIPAPGAARPNSKWLQSRYVKFLRVAQWCVDQVGRGVVALVLSDGIAENLTMSGVRESLLGSFEAVYLLDLGGSVRKAGSDGPDQNIFEIQQGACLLILLKGGSERGVRTFALRGRRQEKLTWLDGESVGTIAWRSIEPRAPGFAFRCRSSGASPGSLAAYWSAPSVKEIFEYGSVAVITGRDELVVGFEERELLARIGLLRQGRDAALFGLRRAGGFDPEDALRELVADPDWQRHLVAYLLRPGDRRVLFAAPYLVSRPRRAVMAEIERPGNLALLLPRRRRAYPSVWVSDCAASHRVAASYEGSYAFPLYVGVERRPNFSPTVLDALASRYGRLPAPEQIFGFLYAQLWSRSYHQRYREELWEDWPRVVFPRSFERFSSLAGAGWNLARLHLGWEQRDPNVWFHGDLPVRLPGRGRALAEEPEGRLRLGLEGSYLAPVGREVMALQVGGYPVVPGWLRRRAGRRLAAHDIEELRQLVETLEATVRWERHLARLEG